MQFHLLNTLDISFFNIISVFPKWTTEVIDKYLDAGRNENMLFYMIHGKRVYSIDEQEFLTIKDGDILFAPVKSRYLSRLWFDTSKDFSTGICIKFDIKDSKGNDIIVDGPPRLLAHDADGYYYDAFIKLHNVIMQGAHEKLNCKILLSQLMEKLITNVRKTNAFSDSFKQIYPAVIQIEQNPQDKMPVAELAKMCFMSERTFRRKFKECTGTSPLNYRNNIRIQKSIELLKSGIYTLEETAEVMGFTDSAHLCKMIKKETNKTTKELLNHL